MSRHILSLLAVAAVATACATRTPPAAGPVSTVPEGARACGRLHWTAVDREIDARSTAPDSAVVRLATRAFPVYPRNLRAAGVGGGAAATFVIDSTGRVLPESRVISRETHREFGDAICAVLPRMRFVPTQDERLPGFTRVLEMPFVFYVHP